MCSGPSYRPPPPPPPPPPPAPVSAPTPTAKKFTNKTVKKRSSVSNKRGTSALTVRRSTVNTGSSGTGASVKY